MRRSISRSHILLTLMAMLALAACTPTPPPASSVTAVEAPSARKVAFEPITGLPDDRATVFATELGGSAVESGLNIVPRDGEGVDFRLKGYVTAKTDGRETVLSHVWDIFDTDGARVHRIEGEVRLPAALPDPWQAVTDDALQEVARQTVQQVNAWLGSGAPVTTADAGAAAAPSLGGDGAGLPSAGEIASATTMHIPAPATTGSIRPSPVQAFHEAAGAHTIYLGQISGMGSAEAGALAAAMQAELMRAGLTPAPSPGEAELVIGAEATVSPETPDGRTVAIIWTIGRAGGGNVGSIRQVRELPLGALASNWSTEARHAAMAATSGLVALLSQNR